MPATWGSPLIKLGVFIGIIYLIHSIICTTYTVIKLYTYVQEKNQAEANGLPFIEDKEATAGLATLLSLSLTCIMTSCLLIWGSIKRNYLFLIPWLIYAAIMIFLTGVYLFAIVYKLIAANSDPGIVIDCSPIKILILTVALILQIVIYNIIKSLQNDMIYDQQLGLLESGSMVYIIQHEEQQQ